MGEGQGGPAQTAGGTGGRAEGRKQQEERVAAKRGFALAITEDVPVYHRARSLGTIARAI